MTSAADVIGALADLHEKQARRIKEEPTGVTPGYNPYVGGAINPNGTFRYVRNAAAVLAIDAIYTMSATNTVLGDTTPKRINFNHQVYDPLSQVTTGSSWAFTAAAAGTYIVLLSAPLSIGGGVDWVTADRADLTIQGAVNETICTFTGITVEAKPANVLLDGFRGFALAAADVIYAQCVQNCGTNRDIDTAIASIIIGHL